MGLLVRSQVARLGEALVAVWKVAHVGFLSCMGSQMRAQVKVQGKPLVTQGTLEGFFACVN